MPLVAPPVGDADGKDAPLPELQLAPVPVESGHADSKLDEHLRAGSLGASYLREEEKHWYQNKWVWICAGAAAVVVTGAAILLNRGGDAEKGDCFSTEPIYLGEGAGPSERICR